MPPEPAQSTPSDQREKEKSPLAPRNAFVFFCNAKRSSLRKEHPDLSIAQIQVKLGESYRSLSQAEKAPYIVRNAGELRAEALAGRGRAQEKPARALAAGKKRKASKNTGSDDDEADEEAVPENPESDADDDEVERLACDWSAHPPSFIISENKKKGHYLVARQGLPLTQYGLVSSSAAKLQRLGATGDAACPLPLELIARYEGFVKKFRTDVHSQEENGELDLEALPPGSALEACFVLGKLREPGGELAQLGKNDIWMKVPLLATCRVIQLLLQEARVSSPGAPAKAAARAAGQEQRR
ncbi:hypothetical protein H632_c1577p0, partial [Helicosporidium sp. ATCC 50920]